MIEHEGVIVRVEGAKAFILIEQSGACVSCQVKNLCNASEKAEKIVEANRYGREFRIGERVAVVAEQSLGLKAVFLAYVLPFIIILVALFIFDSFIESELYVGLLGLSTLIPYLIILRLIKNKIDRKFQFSVISIEDNNP